MFLKNVFGRSKTQHSKMLHELQVARFHCDFFPTCLTAQNDEWYSTLGSWTRIILTQKKTLTGKIVENAFQLFGAFRVCFVLLCSRVVCFLKVFSRLSLYHVRQCTVSNLRRRITFRLSQQVMCSSIYLGNELSLVFLHHWLLFLAGFNGSN